MSETTILGRAFGSESLAAVITQIINERHRQDEKWGEQNHPLVCAKSPEGPDGERHGHLHEAERFKFINDRRVEMEAEAWDAILLEEIHEAFAEADPAKVRAEMVQVAAVAVAIIESIDRAAS